MIFTKRNGILAGISIFMMGKTRAAQRRLLTSMQATMYIVYHGIWL